MGTVVSFDSTPHCSCSYNNATCVLIQSQKTVLNKCTIYTCLSWVCKKQLNEKKEKRYLRPVFKDLHLQKELMGLGLIEDRDERTIAWSVWSFHGVFQEY